MEGGRFKFRSYILLLLIILPMLSLSSGTVHAATISGSIYSLSLEKESDAIIEIDTLPKQLFVSKTGDYTFNVNPGNYTLHAHTSTSGSYESIIVNDDGNYTLDLILEEKLTTLPNDLLFNDSGIDVSSNIPESRDWSIEATILLGLIILIIVSSLGVLLFMYYHKNTSLKNALQSTHEDDQKTGNKDLKVLDEYEHRILQLIKKDKRVTQKDVRKEIPLSEAKISLILSDLESLGKIRKIKKGRGNILIFVKD